MVTVNKTISRFSDLNLLFTKHPISKDVTVKFDAEAIKFAVKNLIMTNHYDIPFHPEMGTNIVSQLFENYSPTIKNVIEREIAYILENYEPRAKLDVVHVLPIPMENAIELTVVFSIQNYSEPITLTILLERVR